MWTKEVQQISAPERNSVSRLAVTMVRYRRRVFAGWLIAVAVGLLGLPHLLGSLLAPPIEVAGSDSQRAGRMLAEGLPTLGDEPAIAVLHSSALTAADPAFGAAIDAGMAALGRAPGVTGVLLMPVAGDPDRTVSLPNAFKPLRPLFHDERAAYLLVGMSGDDRQRQDRSPALQEAVDRAARSASGDAVQGYVISISAFGERMQQAEIHDLMRIELVAVPLAIILLWWWLRTPVGALIPMLIAGASIVTTLGLFSLLTRFFTIDGMLLVGINAVGLGIGIDYALFVMNRYREELSAGAPPERAIGTAMAITGRTVLYSGLLLLLAAVTLCMVRRHVVVQAAIGTMAVVVVTMVATVSLLPALLVSMTEWLGWRPGWMRPVAVTSPDSGRLSRYAAHLMRPPWPYVVGITAALLLAASPMPRMALGVNAEHEALAGTAYLAGHAIVDRDVPGSTSVVTVVLSRPADTAPPDTGPLLAALRADPEVAAATRIDNGSDLTAVLAVPRHTVHSPAVVRLVERIRTEIAPATVPSGIPVLVGGPSALVADILAEISARMWWVIAATLMLTFLVLVVVLRSLLLPLKALVMSLLATSAAFGLMVLLFQRDGGDEVSAVSGGNLIWPQVPLIVFAVLFALSTDYELFLVRRMQEEYLATGDNRYAVATGLQRTARPISLAAVIIAVGFGSLLVSDVTGLQEFGFAAATALIIDATLIRLVLVPALMQIMGRWNWWLPEFRRGAGR
ncbi:MMPL family transporter [Nocardia transvalensis]|uniref:MMPL family transporter n=1 Tax=Nocardia transvalensis TaxID=37333 RepID=UPI00189490DC|nr:MMPL family transporter [Nocardia transvalensis]MBF6330759.1 MMPL family transporter [Nocardia transvalensis]